MHSENLLKYEEAIVDHARAVLGRSGAPVQIFDL